MIPHCIVGSLGKWTLRASGHCLYVADILFCRSSGEANEDPSQGLDLMLAQAGDARVYVAQVDSHGLSLPFVLGGEVTGCIERHLEGDDETLQLTLRGKEVAGACQIVEFMASSMTDYDSWVPQVTFLPNPPPMGIGIVSTSIRSVNVQRAAQIMEDSKEYEAGVICDNNEYEAGVINDSNEAGVIHDNRGATGGALLGTRLSDEGPAFVHGS